MMRFDLLTSGYASMDHMLKIRTPAQVGYTSLISNADNTQVYYGGCSVNIAYALCRLGLCAMPVLRVGRDYEAIGFKQFLEEHNIPTEAVSQLQEDITSVCYLVQDLNGEHITLFYPGAMDGKYARPLESAMFTQARMGIITVGSRQDNELFFDQCQKNAVPLAFGMKGDMDAFPADFLRKVLKYCKLIFCNETERKAIEKLLQMPMGDLIAHGNAEVIITTMGGEGSHFESRESSGQIPVYRGATIVDTTGSGDAYISGFLYGHLKNRSVRECAMLGAVLASFALEATGCCTGLPEEPALLERYGRYVQQLEGAY